MLVLPARADDDQDRARDALARGLILPLSEIMNAIKVQAPGRVIEVEFDEDDGQYKYEMEILQPDGRLLELEVDAQSGRILDRDYEDDD